MSTERDRILSRVRAALAPLPARAAAPAWESELIRIRQAQPTDDPWSLFAQRNAAVNGVPLTSIAELIALLDKNGWKQGYCDPELWPQFADAFPVSFKVKSTFDRTRIDDYAFGITRAAGAIAETGTLIFTDAETSSRLAALAPWAHVAVVQRAQIHPDLTAALAALPTDPNVIWVTGPSKTADVEGILIEGVHGPGVQIALCLD